MVNNIILVAREGSLNIRVESNGWCRLILSKNKKEIRLGADSFENLKNRLIYIVSHISELVMTDDINGCNVEWVCNLNEEHASVYVSRDDNGLLFYFQGLNANIIDTLFVTYDECNQWLNILARSQK